MRERPFIAASEAPRPFSEIRAERDGSDLDKHTRDRALKQIASLEGEAFETADPAIRKRLLCEAEALRCAIDEQKIWRF